MVLARVLGTATSTVRHPSMAGWKLLVAQPLMTDDRTPDGDPLLAVDSLGAGRGATVIVSSDGRFTRELLGDNRTPVRWCVIGIRDE